MHDDNHINSLIIKRILGTQLSEDETAILNAWLEEVENHEVYENILNKKWLADEFAEIDRINNNKEENKRLLRERIAGKKIKFIDIRRRFFWRYAAAAAAIVLIVVTAFWLMIANQVDKEEQAIITDKEVQDVPAPDITKARITLANGHMVELDTLTSGILAVQGNINVIKTDEGQISYKASPPNGGGGLEGGYNTLTNPRGSNVVSITLSDDTKVWLNSESSLKYPVTFNAHERRIELSGEAYFEVAPSISPQGGGKKRPFFVTSNTPTGDKGAIIEVLGTHFNVNNYANEEAIEVTLLEGSVKVSSTSGSTRRAEVVIKPGQQAVFATHDSRLSTNDSPDMEQVMAWKNGTFYFSGESLEAIMKQLARWYDLEVEYESTIPTKRFGGMISRNKNLSEVLRVLELNDVHFRIEGRKIIVMK